MGSLSNLGLIQRHRSSDPPVHAEPAGGGTVSDGMLSVLPLHHTFEFSCGLLVPLLVGIGVAPWHFGFYDSSIWAPAKSAAYK